MTGEYSWESIHARIYHRLLDVIPDLLTIDDAGISEVAGLMPLHFDVVQRTPDKLTISLDHRHRHESGSMVVDPEMTVAVYLDRGMAEALTYRDAYMSEAVYSSNKGHIDILAKRVLNDTLHTWLGNLFANGYSIKATVDHD